MSDKDEIKELFQKELGNYEAKVDPSLWNGIQSGLTGASAGAATATGISVATKAVIGVVIATAVTVSSIVIFSNEETKTPNKVEVEKTESTQQTLKNNSEEIVIKETNDNFNPTEEGDNIEIKEKSTPEQQENISIESRPDEVSEIKKTHNEVTIKKKEPKIQETLNISNLTEEKEEKRLKTPLIADVSIYKQDNQYVKFNVNGENIEEVEWLFGDGKSSGGTSPEHFYEESGNFEVIAIIHGKNEEVIEKTIHVEVELEGKLTKLPNTFTPNNDGVNDEFFIEHEGIEEFQLNIFNNRQEVIFSTNDADFRWKGYNLKGEKVPNGEYVYVIIAKDKAGNGINKYKTLTITR